MRNHSHCRRNKLKREGGWARPSPGRRPGGAKNSARNPASSSMLSDWYPEKSRAAATKERKQTKQKNSIPRGHTSNTTSSAAIMPTQHSAISIGEPLEIQSSEGTYQKRRSPGENAANAWRYSP